ARRTNTGSRRTRAASPARWRARAPSRAARPLVEGGSSPVLPLSARRGRRDRGERGLASGQAFQRIEHAVGAGVELDRRDLAPEDEAVAVDDEERALRRPDVIA